MRLIDADRLKEDLTRFYDGEVCARNLIDEQPTAEPKTGWWIDDGTELGCQCSECGKSLDEYINCGTEYMTLTEIPKFCPNCGLRNFLKMEVEHDYDRE